MEPRKRLYRSETNRMIAGVCGGLGEFFGIDPTLVRLLFVLFALMGGGGIIAYLIMWLLIPTQSKVDTAPRDVPREGLEEMREGVERGARGAKEAFERWRERGGEEPEVATPEQPPARTSPTEQPLEPPPPPVPPPTQEQPPGEQPPRP